MIPKEITDRFKDLTVYQERSRTESYIEVVLFNKDLQEWSRLLNEILGPPAKEASNKPTKELLALSEPHGGIGKGQTLYKMGSEEVTVVAMLWPWQNGQHTTLKLFTAVKEDRPPAPEAQPRPGFIRRLFSRPDKKA